MALEHAHARIFVLPDNELADDIAAFLVDCRARRLSPKTVLRYSVELERLRAYLTDFGVTTHKQITATHLRSYLIHLEQSGHNPGGQHFAYRTAKTFFRWHEREYDHEGQNPISKLHAPKLPKRLLNPAPLESIKAMLASCNSNSFLDMRDRALIMALLDTGARASEFCALDIVDVNLRTGDVTIRHGKGDKARVVRIGAKTRRELRRYLYKHRSNDQAQPALWVGRYGERLTISGLWRRLAARAKLAGVSQTGPHSFRRAFAILSLRGGMDMESLRRLLGHADLSVISRYLAETRDDLREAHDEHGPVDRLL